MKQAYAALALRHHPDRQPAGEAAASSAHRMAEVNAAWSVLRSPAARAAYDDELARAAAATRPSGAPAADDVVAGAAPLRRGTSVVPAPTRPWGCVLTIIGLVLAAVVVTAYVAGRSDDPVEVTTRDALAPGACVLVGEEPGGTVLVEVPCTADHDAVVVERTVFPRSCPLRTRAVLLPDAMTLVCLSAVSAGP